MKFRQWPAICVAAALFLGGTIFAADRVNLPVELHAFDRQTFLHLVSNSIDRADESTSTPDFLTLYLIEQEFISRGERDDDTPAWRNVRQQLELLLGKRFEQLELSKLRRLVSTDQTPDNVDLIYALIHRLVAEEVKKICADRKLKPHFTSEIVPFPVPTPFQFSADLQPVVSPFARFWSQAWVKGKWATRVNGDDYNRLLRAVFDGKDKSIPADEFLQFGRGPGDLDWALCFLRLLRERKVAEALGASMIFGDAPKWMRPPGRPFDQWRIDLLKFCGVDWEKFLIQTNRTEFLAAAGSEKTAQLTLTSLKEHWAEENYRYYYLADLQKFLIPGDPSEWDETDPRRKISPAVQSEILDLLNGAVTDGMKFEDLSRYMQIFQQLHRPETKSTLQKLLQHPSATFAERAADVLRSMGQVIPPTIPAPPVRFRVYLNDRPHASAQLECRPGTFTSSYPFLIQCLTDKDGFCSIPRDRFLDPAFEGNQISFTEEPNYPSPASGRQDQPWVETHIPKPIDFDKVTEIRLSANPLAIDIDYASPRPAPLLAGVYMRFMKHGSAWTPPTCYRLNFDSAGSTAPEHLEFSALEAGKYQLFIIAPGSAIYFSGPIEVKPGIEPFRVKLEKGSHIYATILVPVNGREVEVRLYRGGEDVTETYQRKDMSCTKPPLFFGVPKGQYQLRVLSTAEYMRLHDMTQWGSSTVSTVLGDLEAMDCEGASVNFTVDDNTPAMLNLGKIQIKPVAGSKVKPARSFAISTFPE